MFLQMMDGSTCLYAAVFFFLAVASLNRSSWCAVQKGIQTQLRLYGFALEFWWNTSCVPVASRKRFEEPDLGLTAGALRPNAVTASLEESAKVQTEDVQHMNMLIHAICICHIMSHLSMLWFDQRPVAWIGKVWW